MARRKKTQFATSARENNRAYGIYLLRLTELAISMFDWKNLPDTIDPRFLELTLFTDGQAVFFQDEELGYLALQCIINGQLNVYRIPIQRRAFAVNGYQRQLNIENSVIIYNNLMHVNSEPDIRYYARRLWNLDRIIDVNVNAQKTPVLIQSTEEQRLTMLNLYKEYDGNVPVIMGDKNLDINGMKALKTDAPYVSDKIYQLKTQIWNEALTYLGISNVNMTKKERLISDEVIRNQGGVIANRNSRLKERQSACEQINRMFGLDMWCEFDDDMVLTDDDDYEKGQKEETTEGGESNE